MKSRRRGIHLFRFAGVDVWLHWYWFLFAAFEISNRANSYSSLAWNAAEYLALFFFVLLHEYGHALACRQVGGTANEIMLWPLGGMAYVAPPLRPGATLWSNVAGPLVNVAVLIVLGPVGYMLDRFFKLGRTAPNVHSFLLALAFVNILLLAFNLLPIYPLDGGQIIRSLLWYAVGRARSLMAAVAIGFVGVAGLYYLALRFRLAGQWEHAFWMAVLATFILASCWGGWREVRILTHLSELPRREGFACPSCKATPPVGSFWKCSRCAKPFDTFQSRATCPNCGVEYPLTMCLDCRRQHPMGDWDVRTPVPIDA
jgi:Zn-dependent protease